MRILTLDIETSPNRGYAFRVWQNNMMPNQIIEPTYMLSWAAKWLGEPQSKVVYRSFRDQDCHTLLHSMLCEADMLVTYNGDKFDLRHINREFVERNMPRPRPTASVDLLKTVKKMFCFPHNRLDYVCSELLAQRKLETGGFDLWPQFMDGDEKAIKTMRKYNIKDVVLTEKLYKYLRGWIPNHPNVANLENVEMDDLGIDYDCGTCGSKKIELHRPRRTRCFLIRTYRCKGCGAWHDGKRKKVA